MKIIGETVQGVAEGILDDGACVILLGDFCYGFSFVGPFKDFAAADRYGQGFSADLQWTIEQLIEPDNKVVDLVPALKRALK